MSEPTTDLARVEMSDLDATLEAASAAIETASSPEELAAIRAMAAAAEAWARANGLRENYFAAAEVRLRAERRVGELRSALTRSPSGKYGQGRPTAYSWDRARELYESGKSIAEISKELGVEKSSLRHARSKGWASSSRTVSLRRAVADFDEEIGVSDRVAAKLERFAEIPPDRFAELLEAAKEADLSMTVGGFLARDGRSYRVPVERGIVRVRDGRLAIEWSENGRSRMRILKHSNIELARKSLARARGKIRETKPLPGSTVGDANHFVRSALAVIDRLDLATFTPEGRHALDEAIRHLHAGEDKLVIASLRGTK